MQDSNFSTAFLVCLVIKIHHLPNGKCKLGPNCILFNPEGNGVDALKRQIAVQHFPAWALANLMVNFHAVQQFQP